jgi:acyl-CoA dehydrogenase
MLMQSLAVGRAISLPALSAGAAKFACRNTGAYARIRKQFNQPIGQFEGVEDVLARMVGETGAIGHRRRC